MYKKSCFQPRELFSWCYNVFFFLICFLIGKLYIGFSSQKVVELAIFGVLGKLYTWGEKWPIHKGIK